jgi:hypothetical protein
MQLFNKRTTLVPRSSLISLSAAPYVWPQAGDLRMPQVGAGSTVIDVYPGDGDWTRVLSDVVGPSFSLASSRPDTRLTSILEAASICSASSVPVRQLR